MSESDTPGPASWDELMARLFGQPEGRRPIYRLDIGRLMSAEARDLLVAAAQRAAATGARDIDTDHILWAALKRDGLRALLQRAGANTEALQQHLERISGAHDGAHGATAEEETADQRPPTPTEGLTLTPASKRALLQAHQISRAGGSSYIGPEHLLMALAVNPNSPAGRALAENKVVPDRLRSARELGSAASPAGGPGTATRTGTETVDEYGLDLTALARDGRLEPVVGREDEIEQAIEVLSRRSKNSPVLIGEAGVGKTAIVEGIAQRIAEGDVPVTLAGRRVVQLDLAGLVAGTRFRGDFEERLKRVIDEVREHGDDLILFLDELHTIVGAGASGTEGGLDASNMIKPALARGELRVIGATTIDEYRTSIERDAALARRFQPILVPEPSVEETVAILNGLKDGYEAHHQVRFTDEALVAAAELADRYLSDRFLPDKAIDLVDQAAARIRLSAGAPPPDRRQLEHTLEQLRRDKEQAVADEQYERASQLRDQIHEVCKRLEAAGTDGLSVPVVDVRDIAQVVSRATGIPVEQLTEQERERLLRLEGELRQRVIGQDDAVKAVAEAVRRSRAGMADPNRPVGSFLFLGPTGVGKTELARALAEALFGERDRLIRLDMSEFQERHMAARLVGAPPGYVGYGEAGQLTEAVRRRPYSVILLDEIEKAHPDVFNMLLQVLDDGRLTDSQGRTVSFRNAVLIMTSNVGSDLIGAQRQALGFGPAGTESAAQRDQLLRRLRDHFRPEFINRIDEIVVFEHLDPEALRQITELMLDGTRRRLHAQDVILAVRPAALDWFVEHGYEPEFGARPMRRFIQRELDNRLSSMLLSGEANAGDTVIVDADTEGLALRVTQDAAGAAKR